MGLFDFLFKKKVPKDANEDLILNEYDDGIAHIKEFEDGSMEISSNKSEGMIDDENHYTDTVGTIKRLKKEKKHNEAIELLVKTVEATENETNKFGGKLAPWYYEQLGIVYRKEKMYVKEVEILERYINHKYAIKERLADFNKRLIKAKELANKKISK